MRVRGGGRETGKHKFQTIINISNTCKQLTAVYQTPEAQIAVPADPVDHKHQVIDACLLSCNGEQKRRVGRT